MRRPLSKVRNQAFLAVGLGAQLQDLLLPEQFERKLSCDHIRKLFGNSTVQISRIVVKDQRVAGFVEADQLALDLGAHRPFAVFEIIDLAFEQGILLKKFDNAKWSSSYGQDVHATVSVAPKEFKDFGGAADMRNSTRSVEHHAEFGFFIQAGFHHFPVTRLEDVQGKVCAGE